MDQDNLPPAPAGALPPAATRTLNLAAQLDAFERLPAAEQGRRQLGSLRTLLRHARDFSPFWRDRLAASGVDPDRPLQEGETAPDLIRDLPVLTRAVLQEQGSALKARAPWMAEDRIAIARTSGSTGVPVAVERYLPMHQPLYTALTFLDNRWHGRDSRRPIAIAKDMADAVLPTWGPLYEALGHQGVAHCRNMIGHAPEDILSWLAGLGVPYLVTTPALALRLAELSLAGGPRPVGLEQIITFGETVTPEIRARVRAAFGARVIDRYSCEEIGWIAFQCPAHEERYHTLSASVLVEILDEAGQPCPPGQAGRVVLTALHGLAMPLIRYEIGDYAEWAPQQDVCACGRTLPVIGALHGRERSFIRMPDGTLRLARLSGEYWRGIAPVRDYRVVQYADGQIEAFVEAERKLAPEELDALRAMLAKVLGHPMPAIVTQAGRIDWGHRWKRQDVTRLDRARGAAGATAVGTTATTAAPGSPPE
ncbi:phenylacetate--CoA ligase family protein [Oceanibaculum nanhaiense]|uniref:phenylacetate--CoA ligase family protein n=1 Tax=Oceanibaculum nanhaiense TaxID=1909734 RepID=UPI003F71036E